MPFRTPIKKIKKRKFNFSQSPFKELASNSWLIAESEVGSSYCRVILHNTAGILKGARKTDSFLVASSQKQTVAMTDFHNISKYLEPTLKKRKKIAVNDLNMLLDRITQRIEAEKVKQHKKKSKPKKIQSQKEVQEKFYDYEDVHSSDEQSDELPDAVSSEEEEEDDEPEEEKEEDYVYKFNPNEPIIDENPIEESQQKPKKGPKEAVKNTKPQPNRQPSLATVLFAKNETGMRTAEDLENCFRETSHYTKTLRRAIGKYRKPDFQLSPQEAKGKASKDAKRVHHHLTLLIIKLDKFFMSQDRVKLSDQQKVLYSRVKPKYTELRAHARQLSMNQDVRDMIVLSEQFEQGSSKIMRQIRRREQLKKLEEKRKQKRKIELDPFLKAAIEEGAEEEGGGGEIEVAGEGGEGSHLQVQAVAEKKKSKKRFVLTLEDAATHDAELERAKEEREELYKLNTSMNELNDMMNDMSSLVDSQQEIIDDIQDKVQSATQSVEKGIKHVQSAKDKQRFGLNKILKKGKGGLIKGAITGALGVKKITGI